MKEEIAAKVIRHCNRADISASLRPNYSGRGMYGTVTTAVEIDSYADAMTLVKKYKLRIDNMGLGYIVY
jgi:hypothetical protein